MHYSLIAAQTASLEPRSQYIYIQLIKSLNTYMWRALCSYSFNVIFIPPSWVYFEYYALPAVLLNSVATGLLEALGDPVSLFGILKLLNVQLFLSEGTRIDKLLQLLPTHAHKHTKTILMTYRKAY